MNRKPAFASKIQLPDLVRTIVEEIASRGAQALVVGGVVRDLALGEIYQDLDIEVHRMRLDDLEALLSRFGEVDLVGKQFGVLKLWGVDADWSVPRRDSRGRHPVVESDPWMGIEAAARRRDLTINAMALDPLDGTVYDPFNGLDDLENKVLRAPDADLFIEDPLRFYRVMVFTARFGMRPDAILNRLCGSMSLEGVAMERIEDEFTRLFLKSRNPSIGLRWLGEVGRIHEILPEAARLDGLEQDPKWHPEGDVWEHTLQVVDAAAGLTIGDLEQDLMLLWSALCHDLGKAGTTELIDGRIRSPGHTDLSGELAVQLMERIVNHQVVIRGATKLSVHHLKPHDFFVNNASPKAFKRLALALAPETRLERLAALAVADYRGRNPEGHEPLVVDSREAGWFLDQAEQLKVQREPERPVLMGRHLLGAVKPGPEMGKLLKRAYEIQLSEDIRDVEELKRRVFEE
jgi:tRNA nucleotidyltransferase (CCA-adding enzyme)